jgi:hypothetical protein
MLADLSEWHIAVFALALATILAIAMLWDRLHPG